MISTLPAALDDRGLEHAETLLHERRQADERVGIGDPRIARALVAVAGVRRITRGSREREVSDWTDALHDDRRIT